MDGFLEAWAASAIVAGLLAVILLFVMMLLVSVAGREIITKKIVLSALGLVTSVALIPIALPLIVAAAVVVGTYRLVTGK